MTQENYTILTRIQEALGEMNTKGDDTLIMADCRRALQQVISSEAPEATEGEEPANVPAEQV